MSSAAISPALVARQFRARREPEWLRLEGILEVAERHSLRWLGEDDLLALPVLYRGALSSLSVARETSLDLDLVTYLEGLCARAYFFVYGVRSTPGGKLLAFFRHDWPAAVASLWRETLIAVLMMAVGVLAGFVLVHGDPGWFDSFVDPGLAQGRDFDALPAELRDTLYHQDRGTGLSLLASFLFTHNAQVSMFCFALGFAFGLPTVMLLVANSTTLGAMLALFGAKGLGFEFAGWLSIHGTTELFAIVLAASAGFRIGWSIVFPGEQSRLAAAAHAGRNAAQVMIGVIVMLMVAAVLEGFGRQLVTSDAARYVIGGTMLLLWLGYFYLPRGRAGG